MERLYFYVVLAGCGRTGRRIYTAWVSWDLMNVTLDPSKTWKLSVDWQFENRFYSSKWLMQEPIVTRHLHFDISVCHGMTVRCIMDLELLFESWQDRHVNDALICTLGFLNDLNTANENEMQFIFAFKLWHDLFRTCQPSNRDIHIPIYMSCAARVSSARASYILHIKYIRYFEPLSK